MRLKIFYIVWLSLVFIISNIQAIGLPEDESAHWRGISPYADRLSSIKTDTEAFRDELLDKLNARPCVLRKHRSWLQSHQEELGRSFALASSYLDSRPAIYNTFVQDHASGTLTQEHPVFKPLNHHLHRLDALLPGLVSDEDKSIIEDLKSYYQSYKYTLLSLSSEQRTQFNFMTEPQQIFYLEGSWYEAPQSLIYQITGRDLLGRRLAENKEGSNAVNFYQDIAFKIARQERGVNPFESEFAYTAHSLLGFEGMNKIMPLLVCVEHLEHSEGDMPEEAAYLSDQASGPASHEDKEEWLLLQASLKVDGRLLLKDEIANLEGLDTDRYGPLLITSFFLRMGDWHGANLMVDQDNKLVAIDNDQIFRPVLYQQGEFFRVGETNILFHMRDYLSTTIPHPFKKQFRRYSPLLYLIALKQVMDHREVVLI